MMTFTGDDESDVDEDWTKLSSAVDVYAGVVCEPAVVLKEEYILWHRKWETSSTDSRPKTAVSSLFRSE